MIPSFASRVRSAGREFEMITLEVWQGRASECARGPRNRRAVKPRTKAERFFMDNLGKRNRTGPEVKFREIVARLGFQIKRHVNRGCRNQRLHS
jgi:hypothetical protein